MKSGSFSGLLISLWIISLLCIAWYGKEISPWKGLAFLGLEPIFRAFLTPYFGFIPGFYILSNFLLQWYHSSEVEDIGKWNLGLLLKWLGFVLSSFLLTHGEGPHAQYFFWVFSVAVILVFVFVRAIFQSRTGQYPSLNIRIKTEGRKLENDSSFHWKMDNGFINLINPFQGVLVVGGAGSGKTYTIILEIIQQSINKGFSGLIYDYKFPELTEFTHQKIIEATHTRLKFFSVNFTEPEKSHRLNPLHPKNLPISLFAGEYSSIILKNLKKDWVHKQDFWADNAISYLKAIIWFLKKHEPQFCTLPHAIAMALGEYPWVLEILSGDMECKSMISSLWTAYRENAQAQIAGCISSLQNPLDKLNNPQIFWILTGNEVPLNLNHPEAPSILCLGNSAPISESLSPIISLIASVVMKNLNQKGKEKSIFLLDEAPTLYIPQLKDLPNTGRSNRVATIYCCQDFSQMDFLYGKEESKVIRASLGNQFYGMVNDFETSSQISQLFGKEDEMSRSKNVSASYSGSQDSQSSTGFSYSLREKEVLKPNAALYFEPGFFVGKLTASKKPFFAGRPQIPHRDASIPLPSIRKFPNYSTHPNPPSGNLLEGSEISTTTIQKEFDLEEDQQNPIELVINWNYRKVFFEIEEIMFRNSH